MKAVLLTLLLGLSFTVLRSQSADCDITQGGLTTVNAANTANVSSVCVGQVANFKFSIYNGGSSTSCTIPVNTVEAVFSFPGTRYNYNGPSSFSTGYFTWTYNSFDDILVGRNTIAIPNGLGDADVLVPVIGATTGSASSVLNITQEGSTSDNPNNNSSSASLIVVAAPTAMIAYSGSPYCNTGTATVTQTGQGGGTYSSTSGLSINPTTGAINLATSTPGNYTITYTFSNGTCSGTTTTYVTITAAPTASITYAGTPYCTTVTTPQPVSLTGTGAYLNGTFSSSPPGLTINTTTGDVTPSTSTPGTYTVTYTTPASGGCAAVSTTAPVTITAAPTASLSYSGNPFCTTVTSALPTLTGTGAFTGGTYSSTTGLTINSASGEINPSTSIPGNYTVTYTTPASGGCAAVSTTAPATITAQPTANISYTGSPFCTTASPVSPTLTGTGAFSGGTYSAPAGLSIDGTSGVITPSTSTPGTYTVTYMTPASGGCAPVTATTSVTITAAPTANISYSGTPFCTTVTTPQPVSLTGTGAYLNGVFSSSPSGLSISTTTGDITPSTSTPGTYTVTYNTPASGGCAAATATTSVTITAAPTANISYSGTPYCTTVTTPQPVSLTGTGAYLNGTFSSSPPGLTINTTTGDVTPSTSTPSNYTVTYTTQASGGCAAVSTTTGVTVTAAPNAGTLSGTQAICSNGTTQITTTGTGGTYSSSAPGVATVNASTGLVTGVSAGQTTITYTVAGTGGCSDATATIVITVTAAPNAGMLGGNQNICVAGTTTFFTNARDARGGTFTSDNTSIATVNPSTGDILGIAPGTATITYTVTGTGGCANATATRTVTVNALPTATITGNNGPICSGSNATFTLSGTSGATVTYNLNGGGNATVVLTGGTATVTVPAATTNQTLNLVSISEPVNGCSQPLSGSSTVTVTATNTITLRTAPATENQTVCINTPIADIIYNTSGATGATFVGLPSGVNGSFNTGNNRVTISGTPAAAGSFPYTVTLTGGCGTVSASGTITVNAALTPTVTLSANPSGAICAGTSVTFTATASNTGGGTVNYNFKVNGSSVQNGTSNVYTSSMLMNGDQVSVDITITSGTCLTTNTTTSNVIMMVVNPAPTGSISGTTTVPQNNATTSPVTFTGSGGTTPYTFTYNVNSGSTQTVMTTGANTSVTVNQSNATVGTYTYTLLSITSANGCSGTITPPATATITVTTPQPFDLFANIPRPTTVNFGNGDVREGYVQISNATANPTTGLVEFRIFKVNNFTLAIPPGMTMAASTPVNNSSWTITNNGLFYTITSSSPGAISGNSNIKIGFTLTATGSAGTRGIMTLSLLDDTGGTSPGTGDSNGSNNQSIKEFNIN